MTFKAIETQEELDRILQERLARQKETLEKQYADYAEIKTRNKELETEVGTLQTTIKETNEGNVLHDQTVADLNAKIAGFETASLRTKIALQHGLPLDLADRLVGSDEESIKADAERMAPLFKATPPVAPLKNVEPKLGDGKDAGYKKLLENLKTEGE